MTNFENEYENLTAELLDKYLTVKVTRFSNPDDIKDRVLVSKKEAPFCVDKNFALHILSYGYHGDLRYRAKITSDDEMEVGRLLPSQEGNKIVAQFDNKLVGLSGVEISKAREFQSVILKHLENYLGLNISYNYKFK